MANKGSLWMSPCCLPVHVGLFVCWVWSSCCGTQPFVIAQLSTPELREWTTQNNVLTAWCHRVVPPPAVSMILNPTPAQLPALLGCHVTFPKVRGVTATSIMAFMCWASWPQAFILSSPAAARVLFSVPACRRDCLSQTLLLRPAAAGWVRVGGLWPGCWGAGPEGAALFNIRGRRRKRPKGSR